MTTLLASMLKALPHAHATLDIMETVFHVTILTNASTILMTVTKMRPASTQTVHSHALAALALVVMVLPVLMSMNVLPEQTTVMLIHRASIIRAHLLAIVNLVILITTWSIPVTAAMASYVKTSMNVPSILIIAT